MGYAPPKTGAGKISTKIFTAKAMLMLWSKSVGIGKASQ